MMLATTTASNFPEYYEMSHHHDVLDGGNQLSM
jgi:hypothetical protein